MNKFREFIGYIVGIVIIIAIISNCNLLQNIKTNDFTGVFQQFFNNISMDTNNTNKNNSSKNSINHNSTNIAATINIDERIYTTSQQTDLWQDVFLTTKKTIFYLYDDNNDTFHKEISQYFTKNELKKYYNFKPLTYSEYKHYNVAKSAHTKMCNSIKECKQQKNDATNFGMLTSLLENCGKTFCVVNPAKKQYTRIYSRNADNAKKIMEGAKNW